MEAAQGHGTDGVGEDADKVGNHSGDDDGRDQALPDMEQVENRHHDENGQCGTLKFHKSAR